MKLLPKETSSLDSCKPTNLSKMSNNKTLTLKQFSSTKRTRNSFVTLFKFCLLNKVLIYLRIYQKFIARFGKFYDHELFKFVTLIVWTLIPLSHPDTTSRPTNTINNNSKAVLSTLTFMYQEYYLTQLHIAKKKDFSINKISLNNIKK